ncbi:MAG: divalent-cation tolerance protein CutA [Methanocalculus sp. MSAO_Arc1]|uniref:divalent-cation tolerance protein CutA n=1 Tax=Methanocalculus TaxID=71151 RepID=UPI000FF5449D|nr:MULTISPECIES: divalent-cation tolerance protein CutA [unclassified Methanocalculus]MCP1662097.1 periplasmic divalent cation tolerance protein [Methanocalculus sp. AMF5]RQD80155.1 MAG: divalent-cation tolerance protein CutA [Methanocalculus sp. MSAO_Arc1]
MDRTDVVLILCTAPAGEAETIARRIIEERRAACVNITPVHSVFRWEGEVLAEEEHLLICKTTEEQSRDLIQRIEEIHSYDVPEVLAVRVDDGNRSYLDWVGSEVRG